MESSSRLADDADGPIGDTVTEYACTPEILVAKLTEPAFIPGWLSSDYSFDCRHGGPLVADIKHLIPRMDLYFSTVASRPLTYNRWLPMCQLLTQSFADLLRADVASAILAESLDCFATREYVAMHWLRTAVFIKAIVHGRMPTSALGESEVLPPADVSHVLDIVEENPDVVFWHCTSCACVEEQCTESRLPLWMSTCVD